MVSYIIKIANESKESLLNKVLLEGGEVVYSSPVLPIIGVEISLKLKKVIENTFNLVYITETPQDGRLQEIKGSLAESQSPAIVVLPNVNHLSLRSLEMVGWGTTVAVLDSGVKEDWVLEHHDFTGFGSIPAIDHGTKVAHIIRQFSPGSKILSFKVAQDETVKYIDVMTAIDIAVTKSDVISLSLGFNNHDCQNQSVCSLCEIINHYTVHLNKLFVTAAGNSGEENSIDCPGKAQEAITVGSINYNGDGLADYSSRGTPGVKKPNILTSGSIFYTRGTTPQYSQGTSFSTPVVTGIVSSFFSKLNRNIPSVKSYLYSTAKDMNLPEHHQGFGLLDLDSLLEEICNDKSNIKSERQTPN